MIKTEASLLDKIKKEGYWYISDPKTIFVPHGTEESDLSHSLLVLRNKYKYMIQIEIN